jgi:nitroreductase
MTLDLCSREPVCIATNDPLAAAAALISARQNTSAKRLGEPAPSGQQLRAVLGLAAHAPDHGALNPWRFVVVPMAERFRLGEAFARALADRDCGATSQQMEAAREKAQRAPLLLLAVLRAATPGSSHIPDSERLVCLGCAVQNVLLGAQALGFGSGLTSGQAMDSAHLRAMFSLAESERAICFLNIGTVQSPRPSRERPRLEDFVSTL